MKHWGAFGPEVLGAFCLFLTVSCTDSPSQAAVGLGPSPQDLEWAFLDGYSGDGSLNYGSGGGFYPQLAVFGGRLYNSWYERIDGLTRIRVAVWKEESENWRFVDGSTSAGLNRLNGRNALWSRLVVHNGELYCYWHEETDPDEWTIRVARYNGNDSSPGWSYIDGSEATGLRAAASTDAEYASLTSYEGKLYAAWRSAEGTAYQIRVSRFSGDFESPSWLSVDLGTSGINFDPSVDAYYPKLHVHDGKLYAAWYERNGDARQLRVAKYNGNDGDPQWHMVDGGGQRGLNFGANRGARGPQLLTHQEALYAIWYEREAPGRQQVRAAAYNGLDATPSWTFIDGSAAGGLNRGTDTDGWWGRATSFGDHLYLAWSENDAEGYKINLSFYDPLDDTWEALEPAAGFSRVPGSIAEYPHLAASGEAIYLTWGERIDGVSRVFVYRGHL